MASRTKATEIKRANKRKNLGRKRKAHDRNHGTTPKFVVHVDGDGKAKA